VHLICDRAGNLLVHHPTSQVRASRKEENLFSDWHSSPGLFAGHRREYRFVLLESQNPFDSERL